MLFCARLMVENYNLTNLLRNQNILTNKIAALKESIENSNTVPYAVKNVLNNPKLKGIHNCSKVVSGYS